MVQEKYVWEGKQAEETEKDDPGRKKIGMCRRTSSLSFLSLLKAKAVKPFLNMLIVDQYSGAYDYGSR